MQNCCKSLAGGFSSSILILVSAYGYISGLADFRRILLTCSCVFLYEEMSICIAIHNIGISNVEAYVGIAFKRN